MRPISPGKVSDLAFMCKILATDGKNDEHESQKKFMSTLCRLWRHLHVYVKIHLSNQQEIFKFQKLFSLANDIFFSNYTTSGFYIE